MSRRAWKRVIVALTAIATVAAAFWIAGRTALDDGPQGTAGLERLLAVTDADLRAADRPTEGTFVLLADQRGPDDVEEVLDWVAAGGRLVLADPFSAISRELSDDHTGVIGGSFGGVGVAEPGCAIPETAGVRRIAVRDFVPVLRLDGPAVTCFSSHGGPLLAAITHGDGRVLLLADASPLTNELLREEDNALFALRLLGADDGPVVLGSPRPADAVGPGLREAIAREAAEPGLRGALFGGVEPAALGLLLAFLVFAIARGRRLGLSPEPHPISPVPADALVTATASLYRNAEDRAHAAWLVRRAAARRIQRRIGAPADGDPAAAAAHARALGIEDTQRLLSDRPPDDDEELIRLAADLEVAIRELEEMDR